MSAIAGRVLILPKGNYSSTTTYNMLDLVYNPTDANSYICKQNNTKGKDPTNTTYWQLFSQNGITDTQWSNIQNMLS